MIQLTVNGLSNTPLLSNYIRSDVLNMYTLFFFYKNLFYKNMRLKIAKNLRTS